MDVTPSPQVPVVGVILPQSRNESLSFAAVSPEGNVTDHFVVPPGKHLEKVEEELKAFLKRSRPTVIVIGTGAGMQARRAEKDFNKYASAAVEEWKDRFNRDDSDDSDDDDEMDGDRKKKKKDNYYDSYNEDGLNSDWEVSEASRQIILIASRSYS